MILPRDQYVILDDWDVMGLAGTSSNTIATDGDVFVPDHRFVDATDLSARLDGIRGRYVGAGFQHDELSAALVDYLSSIAVALGMARGAMDCFLAQSRSRKPFNLPYPTLADTPSAQLTGGKARTMTNVAAAAIHRHADEVDHRAARGESFAPDEAAELMTDLAYAARMCADAIDMMQLAVGSSTVSRQNPIQRFARDARVVLTHGAIRLDPHAQIIGRNLLCGMPYLDGL